MVVRTRSALKHKWESWGVMTQWQSYYMFKKVIECLFQQFSTIWNFQIIVLEYVNGTYSWNQKQSGHPCHPIPHQVREAELRYDVILASEAFYKVTNWKRGMVQWRLWGSNSPAIGRPTDSDVENHICTISLLCSCSKMWNVKAICSPLVLPSLLTYSGKILTWILNPGQFFY